jgi:hypothetical protein
MAYLSSNLLGAAMDRSKIPGHCATIADYPLNLPCEVQTFKAVGRKPSMLNLLNPYPASIPLNEKWDDCVRSKATATPSL